MRILLFLPACALLAACSDRAAQRSTRTVDVAAAASRGQSDIDNYAAASGHRPRLPTAAGAPSRPEVRAAQR
ncbi:hypothetical protein [Sphingomonas sp. RIT328]|uniref:hypothetical protein n=1 Tax=Sphingomonas sp. RIT328 TaxID=1470591 RepID=UPI000564D00C|nr:hypothetical protein [Sphingomonas sp. RIT328]